MLKGSDAVVYSTIERTKLARAAMYLQENGVHLRSMSEMIRFIVDAFDTMLDKRGVPTIESTHEATTVLQHMFRASLNPGDRKKKTLLENLQQDEELTFNELPKQRGRQPQWTDAEANRLLEIANKAVESPKMQKLLEELRSNGKDK